MLYTIEQMCSMKENQTFDRKSAKIDPKSLARHLVAFANADGGVLAIGIEDNGTITGIDDYQKQVNEILRVPFDFCKPSIMVTTETVDCIDANGNNNHILVITVPQSAELHANHQDDVFYRMGDKSQIMNFDERLQLMYAKGSRYFEDEPVFRSSMEDIDFDFVSEYCKKIGYGKSAEEYIRQNKDFVVKHDGREELSGAAILLFGKNPQQFFKRARVRFVRYDGIEAKVGTEMNVIKDKVFEGRILDVVRDAIDFVGSQIKERTKLGNEGRFVTTPEYPEFAWKELIVNAVAHRDYSIKGTDIQIKMFDDRLTVESPGILPGIVRLNNLRQVHFSRNPKIAEFLHEYDYVKEFGEGIDRLYTEMEHAGLPAPEFVDNSFMLNATIRNSRQLDEIVAKNGDNNGDNNGDYEPLDIRLLNLSKSEIAVYHFIKDNSMATRKRMLEGLSIASRTLDRAIKTLTEKELIKHMGNTKSRYWEILK